MARKFVIVDCESDGPCPGTDMYSLVCFGAVVVDRDLNKTFYGQTRPISDRYDPQALSISGFSRTQHLEFDDPKDVFTKFVDFLKFNTEGNPIFVSDNLAYDWQWINYYCHRYIGKNPFGFSGRRIGDIYSGYKQDMFAKWKHLRKTKHDHNPVNDAIGNAEAFKTILSGIGQGYLGK